jgi:hypothetical protein
MVRGCGIQAKKEFEQWLEERRADKVPIKQMAGDTG